MKLEILQKLNKWSVISLLLSVPAFKYSQQHPFFHLKVLPVNRGLDKVKLRIHVKCLCEHISMCRNFH